MKWKPKKITRGVNTDISIDNGNSDGNEIALDSIRNNSTQSLRLEIDALREENRNLSFEYEKAKEQLLLKVMQNTNEQEKTRVIYEKFFHSENEKTNKIFVLNTQVAALKDELNRRAQEEALRERKLVVLFQHKFKAEVEKYKKQAEEQHRAALLEERSSARLRAEQENAERARQLEGHYKELVNDMRRQQEALEDMARKAEEEMRRTQREEMASLGRIKDNFYSTVQAQQELIVAEQETRYALQRECYYESLLFQVTYLCNSTLSRLARTHLDTEDALRREKDEELRAVERGVEEQVRARVRAELKDKYALYEEALSEREDLIQQLQLQQEELVLERDELLRSTAADAGRRPRGNSRSVEEIEIDMKDTRDIGVNTSFANTNSRSATPPSRNTRHSNNNNNNNTSEGQVSKEKYDGLLRDYQTVKKVMEEQYLSHCRENKTLFDLLKKKEEEIAEEKKAHAAAVTKMKELEDADRRSSSESQTERENLQRTVRNLQSDIERKNSAIADIEAEAVEKLNEKRSRIAELEASVDELQAELARLKRQEDERQEHQREKLSGVGALERRVDELSNQEREYRSAIEAAKQNILMLFSHNKENEKVRESLERALQEKDTQVSKMRSEYEREREEMREKYKKSLDALSQAFMK